MVFNKRDLTPKGREREREVARNMRVTSVTGCWCHDSLKRKLIPFPKMYKRKALFYGNMVAANIRQDFEH